MDKIEEVKKIMRGLVHPGNRNFHTVEDRVAEQIRQLFEPKPDQSGLLMEEEQDACTPTNEQLEAYLAEPDDEVAAKIRAADPEKFREICRGILHGDNIAKAQRDLSYPIGYRDGYEDAMKEKNDEQKR